MRSQGEASARAPEVSSPAPFASLLCAVDLSSVSEACVAVARTLVREGGTVHLLHVARPARALDLDMALAGLSSRAPSATASPEAGAAAARERLAELDAATRDARPVRTELHVSLEEDAAAAISALAQSTHVDAVVVGTHGRLGFGSVLLGSVASEVANESRAPVLIVFPGREKVHGRPLRPPYRSILCPTVLSSLGNDAVPLAYALATAGSTVHLLHVWHHPVSADASAAQDREARRAAALRALEALAGAAPRPAGVRTEHHLAESDDAAETIARFAPTVAADLVVLGTHGRQGLQRVLVGTVASRTIRTGVPVLLVPQLSARD